jgi:hypothetical protein
LHILQYGFKIRKEHFSEQVLLDNVKAVIEKVNASVKEKADPFSAVVLGVDEPWEVCLVKLMAEVIGKSAPFHFRELEQRHLFGQTDGTPNVVRQEIEEYFQAARKDKSMIGRLAAKLEKHSLFEKYQDRFFSLVKSQE